LALASLLALNAVSAKNHAMTLLLAPPLGEYYPKVQGRDAFADRWRMDADFAKFTLGRHLQVILAFSPNSCFPMRGRSIPITFRRVRKRRGGKMKMMCARCDAGRCRCLIVLAAPPAKAASTGKVHCLGVNSCKGKADCHSPKNACKGMNSCKGQGWVFKETAAACEEAGGKALD
jgi:hypothetical protein